MTNQSQMISEFAKLISIDSPMGEREMGDDLMRGGSNLASRYWKMMRKSR